VPVDDREVEILQQLDAAAVPAPVGSELEEVDRMGDRERAREVGEEQRARLERRDENRLAAGIGLRELPAELRDAAADLAAGQVDLPDRVPVRCERGC
jgi:hypothetical protein